MCAVECPDQEVLVAHQLGRLSGSEQLELRDHISSCSSCAERSHATQSLATPLGNWTIAPGLSAAAPLPIMGTTAYRVHGEHARGGIGRILWAEDLRLGRPVALKELISESPAAARRFAREATLTARLQHPSIVPVYEAGTWPNGQPFYAMKFISGRPLSQLIAEAGTLERRMALLPHVIAVAEAIAYAHSKRVIHRDLKPSNILVGEFGETMVVDWGLGKALADGAPDEAEDASPGSADAPNARSDQTALGAVLGTPSFMAPEQAMCVPVDERADVYALGAMLYTLLAGRLPYSGAQVSDVLAAVRAGAAPPLDRVQPGVPPDLLAIVAKAMARAPADRYADAGALAHDLKRYQSGQLVGVRHYSFGELFGRWMARHRLPVTLSAAFALALGAVGFLSVRRVLRERDISQARSNEMIIAGARATLDRDPTATLAWLKQYPLDGPSWEEVRDVALKATSDGAARYVFQSPDEVPFPSFSPDGRQLAVPLEGAANRVEVRDTATGKLVRSFALDHVHAWGTRWSPDGKKLFALSYLIEKQAVEWWDLDSGTHHAVPTGELSAPVAVAADGSGFAIAERGKGVRTVTFDGQSQQLVARANETPTLQYLDGGKQLLAVDQKGNADVCNVADHHCLSWSVGWHANGAAVSPDEGHVVVFGAHVEVRTRDGQTIVRPPGNVADIQDARFLPDGKQIALGGNDRTLRIWDWQRGTVRELVGDERGIAAVAVSPDGRRVAAGTTGGVIRLWDLTLGNSIRLRGHRGAMATLAFSPDSQSLVSSATDCSLRLWTLPTPPIGAWSPSPGTLSGLRVLDEHRVVVTDSTHGAVTLLDPTDGSVKTLAHHVGGSMMTVVSHDRNLIATNGQDNIVGLVDLRDGSKRDIAEPGVRLWAKAFSCDDREVLIVGGDHKLRLYDRGDASLRVLAEHTSSIYAFFTPDCTKIVTQDDKSFALRLLDFQGKQVATWTGATALVRQHGISVDKKRVATIEYDGTLRVWDAATGVSKVVGQLAKQAIIVAHDRDGGRLALMDLTDGLHFFDFEHERLEPFTTPPTMIHGFGFSDDGTRVAGGGVDRTLRLWDGATRALLQVEPLDGALVAIQFTPDGQRIIASDADGMVREWRVEPAAPASHDPRQLRAWLQSRTRVELDDKRALSSAAD